MKFDILFAVQNHDITLGDSVNAYKINWHGAARGLRYPWQAAHVTTGKIDDMRDEEATFLARKDHDIWGMKGIFHTFFTSKFYNYNPQINALKGKDIQAKKWDSLFMLCNKNVLTRWYHLKLNGIIWIGSWHERWQDSWWSKWEHQMTFCSFSTTVGKRTVCKV